jgi:hypothetical protein
VIREIILKHEKRINRISEIVPGFLIWMILTSPFWMSFHFPTLIGNLLILLAVYWFYRAVLFTFGIFIGYNRYKSDVRINWLNRCNKLDFAKLPNQESLPQTTKLPKHLIAIPIGGCKYETLKSTLDAIVNQNYPLENIYLSLSFEERLVKKDLEYYKNIQKKIKDEFKQFGNRLMIFEHPADLPGEVIGAAANRTWANKKAVEVLEKRGESIADFLTTSPDEDLIFHKEYLGVVSYKYLNSKRRKRKFFQTALYLFTNNYWQVPKLIRAWSMSLSLPVLASSVTHVHDRETWSCYTVSLDILRKVNYWDTSIGIDDTPFFWRPYDYFDGDFECVTFFVPLFADSVYHPNKIENYKAQYEQLVRWGWGVVTIPIAIKVLLHNAKIPLRSKFRKLRVMFEIVVLFKVTAILFTVALPIIGLVSVNFRHSTLAYAIPQTLAIIMNMLTLLIIPNMYYKWKLLPKFPTDISKWKIVRQFILEIPLHLVILYTYAFFPFLEGPTKMMFGKKYSYIITEKM